MKFADCLDDIGKNELQNPVDLCAITSTGQIAVADDSNGLIIFDKKSRGVYAFSRQLAEVRDVGSVAYNPTTNCVYVTVSQPPDSKKLLLEIDCVSWETKRTLDIPNEPKMRSGFIYWVATHKDDVFVASGDNKTAVLWRVDLEHFSEFTVLVEKAGDLEHPFVTEEGLIILSEWTEKDDWCIKQFTFDAQSKIVRGEAALVPSMPGCLQPWCACQDEDALYVYDYKTGALVVFSKVKGQDYASDAQGQCDGTTEGDGVVREGGGEDESMNTPSDEQHKVDEPKNEVKGPDDKVKYALADSPTHVPMGQWVSMIVFDGILFMTCSDERIVRVFN